MESSNGSFWSGGGGVGGGVSPALPAALQRRLCPSARHLTIIASSLRMGRKAVGPVCCVMHVKESRTLIVKEKGLCPGVSGLAP